MRILSLNPYQKSYTNYSRQDFSHHPVCKPMDFDCVSISFKGKNKKKTYTDFRLLPGMICACCGKETIPVRDVDKFMEDKIFYKGLDAIKILEKAGYFSKKYSKLSSENKAYVFCKTFADMYPDKTLDNILSQKVVGSIFIQLDSETKEEILRINKMTQNIFHTSSYMVKELCVFEPIMHETEREVFKVLKRESVKSPEKSFSEILNNPRIKEYHLKKLEEKQNNVFKNILKISKTMPEEQKEMIEEAIRQAKEIFNLPNSAEIYPKRSSVLDLFDALSMVLPVTNELLEIQSEIYKLPSSINDTSSFIVKYSNNNPNQIADALIRGAISTRDHVKPKNRINDKGEDSISNYINMCRNCNCERGRMPYPEFERIHPEMPENTQKFIDIIIENINNGVLLGHDRYPQDILRALEQERQVTNPISITKLNLIEAVNNRRRVPRPQ